MEIKQAKVLITGGSSGIGKEVAKLLKESEAQVVIASRNKEKLEQISAEVDVSHLVADVTNESDVIKLVDYAITKMNGFNVLINNAGYGYFSPLIEMETSLMREQINTNTIGAMLCAREAAKHFVNQEYGNIINIGSTVALSGLAGGSAYAATKFALRGMTQSWRNELRKHHIRVMLVNPSEVMTPFFNNANKSADKKRVYSDAEKQSKLTGVEIAHTIKSMLEMNDRGFITEATVFATNPKT